MGTGGEGRVLKVGRDGAVSVLFDAPESNVFALHADADGTLFVGTSPAMPKSRTLTVWPPRPSLIVYLNAACPTNAGGAA